MRLKKLASAGRFGARYGRRIKERLLNSEISILLLVSTKLIAIVLRRSKATK